MRLHYFKGESPNFGDEINPWLWPRLLPNFFDDDGSTVFLGIGSIIGEKSFPLSVRKIVCGSGFVPEYHQKPNLLEDWDVHFVRGPRTAQLLGLPRELAIGDPGVLVSQLVNKKVEKINISFMPHWQSLSRGNWQKACDIAGIVLIDPRGSVENILEQILSSKVLIAEAMHGAIVADALRVPWVAALPLNHVNRLKWSDWADTLGLSLSLNRLLPSSLLETRLSILRNVISSPPFGPKLDEVLPYLAAKSLVRLSKMPPQLSDDSALSNVTEKMLEKIETLKRKYS